MADDNSGRNLRRELARQLIKLLGRVNKLLDLLG